MRVSSIFNCNKWINRRRWIVEELKTQGTRETELPKDPMTDPNLYLQESGWEELRKEARKIEGDLDVKLSSYAKLGARFTQGGLIRCTILFELVICSAFWI